MKPVKKFSQIFKTRVMFLSGFSFSLFWVSQIWNSWRRDEVFAALSALLIFNKVKKISPLDGAGLMGTIEYQPRDRWVALSCIIQLEIKSDKWQQGPLLIRFFLIDS